MKRLRFHSASLAQINIRAASLLVPHSDRLEWTAEWNAELYHLCQCRPSHTPHADPLEFSLGAFRDAFWIRCNHLRSDGLPILKAGSPARCGLLLTTFAVIGFLACLCLPRARTALLPIHSFRPTDLVMISSASYAGAQLPTIPLENYQEWQTDTDKLFSQIAWYYPSAKNVYVSHQRTARLSIALASGNLFRVLGVPGPSAPGRSPNGASLILSRAAWRTWYHGDPNLVGRTANIDGQPVLIAAILPDNDGQLPGQMEAWLLEDQHALGQLPPKAKGFVFARIRGSAFPAPRGGIRVMTETRAGVTPCFECISVAWLARQPTSNFFFALLLACMALPATTALPLGDYRDRLALSVHARRWVFLAMKFLLVLAVVYPASIALAWGPSLAGSTAVFLQVATAFLALLFAFRWILQDQRQRCPECLRLLSNPARVGQASCNFLSWNGTELFCDRGHGLLHIPELPTSWFSTQRWLRLDSSWLCLFPETRSPSPGMV
jgi:hypothetical protein